MSILSDVALHTAFPAKDIERLRDERTTSLLQQRDSPNQTASRIMWNCLYGPTHPYGHITLGTAEAIKKISRDDMLKFYQAYYTPKNAALVVVGDVTESEAKKLANDALGSWTGPPTETPRPPQGQMINSRVVIVDKPGMPQTALRVVQLGLMRSDPDFDRLDLANTNFDVGRPTKRGDYSLADETYAQLVKKLEKRGFAGASAALRANIDAYFGGRPVTR